MEKHFIINIGRQFGSGGKSVAVELGKLLGVNVYDNELIIKAAEHSGLSKSLFSSNDEKKDFLHMGTMFGGNRYYSRDSFDSNTLFRIQSETIKKIAAEESAIFVGRASDYVLRDMDCCLNVFVTADREDRIERICERSGISRKEAEALMFKKDKSRKQFYDFVTTGNNWGVAGNYDLCVNSSRAGIKETAAFILEYGRLIALFD